MRIELVFTEHRVFGYRGDCSHEIEKRPDNAPGLVLFGGLEGLILHRAVTLEH